jgi:TonB family protein
MLLDLSSNRSLGVENGASDAIAVEIVDGATLKDSMEPPTEATQPPGGQPKQTAATPPPEPPQPPEPQTEPQPQPTPPAEAAVQPPTPAPPEAAPQESPPTPEEAAKLAAEALPSFEEAPPAEKTELPKEAPKQEQPKPAQKAEPKQAPAKQQAKQQPPKKKTQTSALDLSVPYDGSDSDSDGGGSSSAVQRPPGITRSGENDEFARNVIRALQKTMPRERARGRVTVRIVLNENGSRADVKLLQSGGDQDLDFNVVFAARGTAYPFPPKKSTLVDRTFTVTYIYR